MVGQVCRAGGVVPQRPAVALMCGGSRMLPVDHILYGTVGLCEKRGNCFVHHCHAWDMLAHLRARLIPMYRGWTWTARRSPTLYARSSASPTGPVPRAGQSET
jgi:hypothetical protein